MDIQRRKLLLRGGAVLATAAAGVATGSAARGPSLAPAPRAAASPPASRLPAPAVQTRPAADARRLFLHNLHTGDTVKAVYWQNGRYLDDALSEARHALRDWRNGRQHPMDARLFDIFHDLGQRLEVDRPFQIISGYRSPSTNAAMHARSAGVAEHSLHIQGKATDLRVEGVDLQRLHRAALSLGRGGVGFYPVSNFVHVDTGRVRQWSGA